MQEEIEMFLEELECILNESPDVRALIESEMHEDEKRTRFRAWRIAETIGDFYEVRKFEGRE